MNRRTPRPLNAVAAVLAAGAVLAVGGCGISPTGPVRAGGPATGVPQRAGGVGTTQLYFASAYGIRQVSRPAVGTTTAQQALDLLLEGPTADERARGLSNHIPPLPRKPSAFAGRGTVDLYLPLSVATGELDNIVLSQMVCTLAHAKTMDDTPPDEVVVQVFENNAAYNKQDRGKGWGLRCGPQSLAVPADPSPMGRGEQPHSAATRPTTA